MLLIVEDPAAVMARPLPPAPPRSTRRTRTTGGALGRVNDPFGHHWEIGKPLIPWPLGD